MKYIGPLSLFAAGLGGGFLLHVIVARDTPIQKPPGHEGIPATNVQPVSDADLTAQLRSGWITAETMLSVIGQPSGELRRIAEQLWDKETNGFANRAGLEAVCTRWALTDPSGFLEWAVARNDATPIQPSIQQGLAALARKDLDAALSLGAQINDGGSTGWRLAGAVRAAVAEHGEEAITQVEMWGLGEGTSTQVRKGLRKAGMEALAESDPSRYLARNDRGEDWDMGLASAVKTLASKDMQQLAKCLSAVSLNRSQLFIVADTVAAVAASQPLDGISAFAGSLPDSATRQRFAEAAAMSLATSAPGKAVDFIAGLTDPAARRRAALAANGATPPLSSQEIQRLVPLVEGSAGQNEVIGQWLSRAGVNAEAITGAANSLAGTSVGPVAFQSAVGLLAKQDASACATFVATRPDPLERRILLVSAMASETFRRAAESGQISVSAEMGKDLEIAARIYASLGENK